MKTMQSAGQPASRKISVRRLWPLVGAAWVTSISAAPPAPTADQDPKTHTLFMGADILVEQGKNAYRVQDVVGGSFVIRVDGKETKVPASWAKIKLKVDRSLKLTTASVQVDHLTVERGYTAGNDPVKLFMARQGESMARADAEATLIEQLAQAQMMKQLGGGVIIPGLTGNPVVLERKLHQEEGRALADFGNFGSAVGQMQDDLTRENFDAIHVEFEVMSVRPVAKPYVVIMARFHPREAKPGEFQNWLYAAQLDPLEAKPQKVRVRMGGFPPGFVIDDSQVHVYDGGQEVATNVADKKVPLTRKEAFAYLLLDYLGGHKGATLPASPAMGRLAPEVRAQLNPEQIKRTYFVKVSPDGLPVAGFVDDGLVTPIDEPMAALLRDVRFFPALDKGKPVEGVAELRFTRLAL